MNVLVSTDRVITQADTSASEGTIEWVPLKSLWIIGHGLLGLTGVFLFPDIGAFVVFVVLTALTICAGHSVGMHRLLIHRSFETTRVIEYLFVWLGTLVGMAGPIGMIRSHDMRDWHQRQKDCPPHPAHQATFFKDAWWQLCCEFRLENPPRFLLEDRVRLNRFYTTVERNWMLQQAPPALILFAFGGWSWVLWGCSLRIFVSLVGHWMVGHFAHRRGQQTWKLDGLPVQGYNLPGLGIITFGENWHGNHHAFPYSAKLGVEDGQMDPGFRVILFLKRLGLAWNIKTPGSEPDRDGLVKV